MNKDVNKDNVKLEKEDIKEIDSTQSVKEKKDKRKNPYYLFLSFVIQKMKEDKLYLLSFIITVLFVVIFSLYKVNEADGLYKHKKDEVVDSNVTPTLKPDVNTQTNDILDVSDYVGVYSREVVLDEPITISDSCSLTSYNILYQIKKDKTIKKFFSNECIGNVLIWEDTLAYVSNGGARYINANDTNFLFSATNMKEVDGSAYKLDSDITNVKENNKIKNVQFVFFEKNIIIKTFEDLVLLHENVIDYKLSDGYPNKGGDTSERVFKIEDNVYKFIVFENNEKKNCYTEVDINDSSFVNGPSYKIYSVEYSIKEGKFKAAKEIVSRDKTVDCDVFNSDLASLKE